MRTCLEQNVAIIEFPEKTFLFCHFKTLLLYNDNELYFTTSAKSTLEAQNVQNFILNTNVYFMEHDIIHNIGFDMYYVLFVKRNRRF